MDDVIIDIKIDKLGMAEKPLICLVGSGLVCSLYAVAQPTENSSKISH